MASGSGERAANDGHRGGRRYDLRPRDGDLDPSAANAIHPATSSKASAGPPSQVNVDELARRRSPRDSPVSSSAPSRSRVHIASSRGQPQSTSEVDDDTWEHVELRRSHDKADVHPRTKGGGVEAEIADAVEDVDTGPGQLSNVDLDDNRQLRGLLVEYRKRLHSKEEKLHKLQAYVDEMQLRGAYTQGKMAEDETDVTLRLQQDNAEKTQELEQVRSQLKVKERVIVSLQQKLHSSQETDSTEEEAFSAYQKHVEDLSKQLEESKTKLHERKQTIKQLLEQLNLAGSLEERVTKYAIEVSQLEEEKKGLKELLEKTRRRAGQPTARDTQDPRLLDEELVRARQAEQQYKQLYEESLEGSKKLLVEISSLTDKVQMLQVSGVRVAADSDASSPAESDGELRQEVVRLSLQVQQKDRRITSLQTKLTETMAAKEDVDRLLQHSKEQSRKVMQLKRQRVALEEGVREGQVSGQSLQESLDAIEDENKRLTDELQMALKDRGCVQEALSTAVAEMEGLQKELQEFEALARNHDVLEKRYERLKEENRKLCIQLERAGEASGGKDNLTKHLNTRTMMLEKVTREKEEVEALLEATKLEAQVYKEDFQRERDDRAKAHGQKDEIRQQYLKEKAKMEDTIRKLQAEAQSAQDELEAHKQALEEASKQLQLRDRQVASVQGASDKAKEETRTKALQVTQYKKKFDELQEKLSRESETNKNLRVSMEEVRKMLEKASAENAGLRKDKEKLAKKMKKPSTGAIDGAMSTGIESKLARMEGLYEAERTRNDDLRIEVTQIRKVQKEICEENATLRELLEQHFNQQEIQERLERSSSSKGAGSRGQSTVSPTSPGGSYPSRDIGGHPQVLHDRHTKDLTATAVRHDALHDALHAQVGEQRAGNQYHGQQNYHGQTIASNHVQPISASHTQVRPDHLHVLSPTEAGTRGLTSGEHGTHRIGSAVAVGGRATGSPASTKANLAREPHATKPPVVHDRPKSDIARPSAYPQYGPPPHSDSASLPLQGVPRQQQGSQERSPGDPRRSKLHQQQGTRLASAQHSDMHKAAAEGLAAHQRPFESSLMPGDGTLDHRLDTMIHRVAGSVDDHADVEPERGRLQTREHIPYDPNLTCPLCYKQFRLGDIQLYRQHTQTCSGTVGTVV